jgi:hypothetical protein
LLISHPHEDIVYKQGSYLSSDAIAALEDMQRHADLLEMQDVVKEKIMQLVNAGSRLRTKRLELCSESLPRPRGSQDTAGSSGLGVPLFLSQASQHHIVVEFLLKLVLRAVAPAHLLEGHIIWHHPLGRTKQCTIYTSNLTCKPLSRELLRALRKALSATPLQTEDYFLRLLSTHLDGNRMCAKNT